jgi:ribose-phosphate pyrophosphokinase
MKTLNLTNLEKSDIKYRIDKFPDRQQQLVINKLPDEELDIDGWGTEYLKNIKTDYPIKIKSRLNNFLDLELIICATKSLRNLGIKEIHLYTPYFLGSRSDRKFEEGSNNYLKDVICPIINSLNFESVTVLDPHSDVLEACLNNFRKTIPIDLVKTAISNIYEENQEEGKWYFKDNLDKFILISPDAGASKKIYKLAEQIGYKGDIITCSKDRDVNGNITATVVPMGKHWNTDKDAIIIDDICDGGATFINIAKQLKANGWKNKIYLIVTHGIFSKGFKELSEYFDGIYCTNSYKDIRLNQPINDILGADPKFVKQLNVF